MSRDYLVKPLELAPDDGRVSLGIAQTDIIIRTAIIAAIADIRANPTLLDYVFSSLPKDNLTFRVYGEEQIKQAKEWFLATDFPVFMNTRVDDAKLPCITIAMQASGEAEATLGDVNYTTSEEAVDAQEEIYGGPYRPVAYTSSTDSLVFGTDLDIELFPGMYVKTKGNTSYRIQEVLDENIVVLPTGTNDKFDGCVITSGPKKQTASLEALEFRESYEIACHVLGEPVYLTYLHSVVLFALLRYKEALIEARGITRSTIQSGPIVLNTSFDVSQPVFTRIITMGGYVRQYWPKLIAGSIVGLAVEMDVVNDPADPITIATVGTEVVPDASLVIQEAYDLLINNKIEDAKRLLGSVANVL